MRPRGWHEWFALFAGLPLGVLLAVAFIRIIPRGVSVGSVEAVWIALTLIGVVITAWALLDALRDRAAIVHLNGDVRSIVARGNVRREFVRFLIQLVFLSLALPAVVSDREIVFTPFIAALMALPALQLVNTASDYIDRRRIARKLLSEIVAQRMKAAQ